MQPGMQKVGTAEMGDEYFVYYGGADKVIALATANKQELLDFAAHLPFDGRGSQARQHLVDQRRGRDAQRVGARSGARRAGGAGGGKMTMNYSKWGEKVSISKPKDSEISDKDFFSQLGGATTAPS